MEILDVILQFVVYLMTMFVVLLIGVKSFGTGCFSIIDTFMSVLSLLVSMIMNVYLAGKYKF